MRPMSPISSKNCGELLMMDNDRQDEIDQLAVRVERKIAETQEFLDDLPEFAPRSDRSRKLQQQVEKHQ
jgi:hypothetical protein